MLFSIINSNQIVEGYTPRKDFSGLEELTESIKKEGLKEPIMVRQENDRYIVISGIRRFRVAIELELEMIPCIIQGIDEKEAAHLSYLANSDDLRKNLNPIEVSQHIKEMRERFGYSVQNLVDLGYAKDDQTIYNKESLLDLPDDIQDQVAIGEICQTIGYELARVKDDNIRAKLVEKCFAGKKPSVRKFKDQVRDLIDSKNQMPAEPIEIPKGDIPGLFFKDSSDMSELKDDSAGLVVTSCPYWVDFEYEKDVTFDDHLGNIEGVLKECDRVLTAGGKICINVGDIYKWGSRKHGKPEIELTGHHIQKILRSLELRLIDRIIWKKGLNWVNNPQVTYHQKAKHTAYRILNNFEYIYIFKKDGEREVPSDIERASKLTKDEWKTLVDGVWDIRPVNKQKGHPAQFPEELVRRLIKMYSYRRDIVLDPFGGSMTTVKVANELGRVGIGYERDEKYKSFIMEKLGIKPEDLVTPAEPAPGIPESTQTKSNMNPLDRIAEIANDVGTLHKENGKEIRSMQIPIAFDSSIEDVIVNKVPGPDEPDPDSPDGAEKISAADYRTGRGGGGICQ